MRAARAARLPARVTARSATRRGVASEDGAPRAEKSEARDDGERKEGQEARARGPGKVRAVARAAAGFAVGLATAGAVALVGNAALEEMWARAPFEEAVGELLGASDGSRLSHRAWWPARQFWTALVEGATRKQRDALRKYLLEYPDLLQRVRAGLVAAIQDHNPNGALLATLLRVACEDPDMRVRVIGSEHMLQVLAGGLASKDAGTQLACLSLFGDLMALTPPPFREAVMHSRLVLRAWRDSFRVQQEDSGEMLRNFTHTPHLLASQAAQRALERAMLLLTKGLDITKLRILDDDEYVVIATLRRALPRARPVIGKRASHLLLQQLQILLPTDEILSTELLKIAERDPAKLRPMFNHLGRWLDDNLDLGARMWSTRIAYLTKFVEVYNRLPDRTHEDVVRVVEVMNKLLEMVRHEMFDVYPSYKEALPRSASIRDRHRRLLTQLVLPTLTDAYRRMANPFYAMRAAANWGLLLEPNRHPPVFTDVMVEAGLLAQAEHHLQQLEIADGVDRTTERGRCALELGEGEQALRLLGQRERQIDSAFRMRMPLVNLLLQQRELWAKLAATPGVADALRRVAGERDMAIAADGKAVNETVFWERIEAAAREQSVELPAGLLRHSEVASALGSDVPHPLLVDSFAWHEHASRPVRHRELSRVYRLESRVFAELSRDYASAHEVGARERARAGGRCADSRPAPPLPPPQLMLKAFVANPKSCYNMAHLGKFEALRYGDVQLLERAVDCLSARVSPVERLRAFQLDHEGMQAASVLRDSVNAASELGSAVARAPRNGAYLATASKFVSAVSNMP